MFFPHLVAGPIVRTHEFLPQLRRRKRFTWNRAEWGVWLFLVGLFARSLDRYRLDPWLDRASSIESRL